MAQVIFGPDGLVKICPRCWKVATGKLKDILEHFGRNASRADGLTTYCRECRRGKRSHAS